MTTTRGKAKRISVKKLAAREIIKAVAKAKHIDLPKKDGNGSKTLYSAETVLQIINLTWDMAISTAIDGARLNVLNLWNKDNIVLQQYSNGAVNVIVDTSSLMELKSLFKNETV